MEGFHYTLRGRMCQRMQASIQISWHSEGTKLWT
jgi:hypothetical protein